MPDCVLNRKEVFVCLMKAKLFQRWRSIHCVKLDVVVVQLVQMLVFMDAVCLVKALVQTLVETLVLKFAKWEAECPALFQRES